MSYFKKPLPVGDIAETVSDVNNALRPLSAGAMAYHGYKRTKSIGWAIGWSVFGALMPLVAPAIAYAEGFAKPKNGG